MAPPSTSKGKRGKVAGEGSKKTAVERDAVDENALLDALAAQQQSPASSGGVLSSFKTSLLVALLAVVVGLALYQQSALTTMGGSPPKSDPSKKSGKTTTITAREAKTTAKALTASDILKRSKTLPCKDRQDPNFCADLAARGDCDVAPGWMTVMCAAACNRCELLDPKKRCTEENMGVKLVDAYGPGDLNKMFEELAARKDLNVTVLHKDPWMILVRNFIPESEGEMLLKLTEKGLRRSTDQGQIGEDGFQEQVVSNYRTSSNSWCNAECETHPKVKQLMQRISDLVHVPVPNFEAFQVLRYEKTQKYDVHHDASPNDFAMSAGPRILTFFMYLSDVEEGGETFFPKLDIKVRPEKGSALLWPSVESDFPNSKIEEKTYHAALPVTKGVKLAANSWIHLRDYKTPNHWGCTGAFD